ncbi:MAG: TonB-dependent receptor [Nibricoccus sp.]
MNQTHTKRVGGLCSSIIRRCGGFVAMLLGVVALATTASAQTATITGRVLNQGTGGYLKYAQIQVVGTDKVTFSEDGGLYTLTGVPAGEVKLSVSYTGLDTQEITVTVPAQGSVTKDISLSSASEYGDTIKLGEFKVASAREGNARAIVEQRLAPNIKTVIAADAFGDVSEGNVGEFLRLLPGVTVDYVDNDVRTTRIRGLPGKYALTTMDGHAIATAGSASINTGRQFELEQVSLTSLDTIETSKSPTPDMQTPGLAGNTNIISKSAFSQKGRSIKYSAGIGMSTKDLTVRRSDGWNDQDHYKMFPVVNAEWIDTLMDGRLGIVLSAGHSSSYNEQNAITGSYTFDRNPYNNSMEIPLVTQIQLQNGPKITDRESVLLNLEFKASDDLKLALRTSYGNYKAEFYNRNWTINASTTAQLTSTNTANVWSTATNNGMLDRSYLNTGIVALPQQGNYFYTTTAGTTQANQTQTNAAVTGSNFRKSGGTFVISPAMSWKLNDFKIDAATSFSRATSMYRSGADGYFSYIQSQMNNVAWNWAKTGERSYHIQQTNYNGVSNTGSMLDISNYTSGGTAINEIRDGEDRVWTANADLTWDRSDWAIPTTFKAGASTQLKVLDINVWVRRWGMTLTNTGPSSATAINLGDYVDPYDPDTAGGVELRDINGRVGSMPSADKWKLYSLFKAYGNDDPYSMSANGPFKANVNQNLRAKLQNQFDIEEKIHAGYMMATFQPMKKLSIVAGLRFEKTETIGRSYDDKGLIASLASIGITTTAYNAMNSTQKGAITGTGSSADNDQALNYVYYRYGNRSKHTQDYTNTLPSVQAKYNFSKNLLVRAAYYKSLLRPDFQHAVGGVTVSDPSTPGYYSFTLKNSDLKPEMADNFDASVEYYMEPVGLVSVAVFYKDVKDIQVSTSQTINSPSDLPEAIANLGIGDISYGNATISTYTNGPKTNIWGGEIAYKQELSFLPVFLKGFGVDANYTYIHPEDDRLWALVANPGDGLSKNAFNFILRYNRAKFSGQITTTWADKKINAISNVSLNADGTITPTGAATGNYGLNTNTYTWIRDRWQVNLNLNYKLHRRATLFLNVSNLFNEPQYRYTEQPEYINRHGNYGTQFTVGVKGQF